MESVDLPDKIGKGLLFGVLILMPLVSFAGGLGVAPLAFILGIWGLISSFRQKTIKISPFLISLFIFLLWLCITAIWSPYRPDDLLTNYLKLLIMGLVFYFSLPLFKSTTLPIKHLLMATTFFAAGLVVIDVLSNFSLTFLFTPPADAHERALRSGDTEMNFGHATTILVLLCLPVAMLMKSHLKFGSIIACLFMGLIGLGAWLNGLSVGLLGLFGVIAASGLAYMFPKFIPRALLAIAIIAILAAPVLAYFSSQVSVEDMLALPLSWEHRLRMWGYCWPVIAESPIFGTGFDASRTFTDSFIARDGREITTVSLHPHNVGIQIWVEVGLVGAVLASAVLMSLFKPLQNYVQSRERAVAVSGVIAAGLIISSITYGAWQFWWWASIFMAIGALHFLPKEENNLLSEGPKT